MKGRALLVIFALLLGMLVVPLTRAQVPADIVLRPGRIATVAGAWAVVPDTTAAGGAAIRHANAGAAKLAAAQPQPTHYVEVTFAAEAGMPYRLWIRGKAQGDDWGNDSVFVQFSGSVDAAGSARYRIGTTSALEVNLEECSGCGLSGWGWQDTGWGAGVLGPEVRFAASGTQRMRIQTREDGFAIDQVVLSPDRYLMSPPGPPTNDATIVPQTANAITVVRRPYLQQAASNRVVVVWATREAGTPRIRLTSPVARTIAGSSRLVPASRNGLGYDYYHHEVAVGSLSASTEYRYEASLADRPFLSASFRTASSASGDVSFIVFGDSGTGSAQQRQLAGIMTNDPFDLALHAGDIAYGNSGGTGDATYRTYNDWFFDVYAGWLPFRPFFPSPGNHDSRPTNGNGIAYLDTFTLPTNGASAAYPDHAERYYSFDYGPVHFVALDTETTFQDPAKRAAQLSWLESDLASTSRPWKVAFYHRSPYSSGAEHGSDLIVRGAFAPIFEQYGVQLSLSAHDHDYERSWPQNGVTYIVSGGGGGPLYSVGSQPFTAFSASRHHYLRAEADSCTITLRAIGLNGAQFDSATLSRCQAVTPDVVLYPGTAAVRAGAWIVQADSTAADGRRVRHPDSSAAKLANALAQPQHYFEMTFEAAAGIPYRLWIRARADANHWSNDSVFVQFDGATDAGGTGRYRIGSTDATTFNLEECSGCGLSNWGWEDNGWGRGVLGAAIYFRQSGPQRLRIQTREDGIAIDQIVLSPQRYLTRSPGALKNDTTIVSRP